MLFPIDRRLPVAIIITPLFVIACPTALKEDDEDMIARPLIILCDTRDANTEEEIISARRARARPTTAKELPGDIVAANGSKTLPRPCNEPAQFMVVAADAILRPTAAKEPEGEKVTLELNNEDPTDISDAMVVIAQIDLFNDFPIAATDIDGDNVPTLL